MPEFGFIGAAYAAASLAAEAQECINLYPEMDESQAGRSKMTLYQTPGLRLFTTLPKSPIRALWGGEKRVFAVAGTSLYEVFQNGTFQDRCALSGATTLINDGLPATISANGIQLLITSGLKAYCDNGGGPVNIDTFNSDGAVYSARVGGFLDGFFIITGDSNTNGTQKYGPRQFNVSGSYDGTSWSTFASAVKEATPDEIQGMIVDHEELWLFGDLYTTEVFRNVGNPDMPFQRDPSAVMNQPCGARFSPVSIANSVCWLGQGESGGPVAWMAKGYYPVRVSTSAIEAEWARYSTISDAVAFDYIDGGHQFWVISFPSGNATWVWDALTQLWHRRGSWSGSTWNRHRVAFHTFEWGMHLGGDYGTGQIWQMDRSLSTDNGVQMKWRRTAPYIAGELQRIPQNKLRLDLDAAATTNLVLNYSDDQARTWSADRSPDGIRIDRGDANKAIAAEWRRLAQARLRLYRVTGSGSAPTALVNCYVNPPD